MTELKNATHQQLYDELLLRGWFVLAAFSVDDVRAALEEADIEATEGQIYEACYKVWRHGDVDGVTDVAITEALDILDPKPANEMEMKHA